MAKKITTAGYTFTTGEGTEWERTHTLAAPYAGPLVEGATYRHKKSGKLYKLTSIENPYYHDHGNGCGGFLLKPAIGYYGLRNGKKFGPWRSATPAVFEANFVKEG